MNINFTPTNSSFSGSETVKKRSIFPACQPGCTARVIESGCFSEAWNLALGGLNRLCQKSAVHPDVNSCDETAGFVAGQEEGRADQLVGLATTRPRRAAAACFGSAR